MADPKRKFYDALDDLLDRPIAYNPAFRRITGSTVAAILLSQAWYWSKRHKQDDGWFYKSGKEWEEETGLSRSEQETARRHCGDTGVLEEKLKGVPATVHYRVCKERLYELMGIQFAGIQQTEIAETPQTSLQGLGKFADKLQSGVPANFNKEPETPPMIPTETPQFGADWYIGHNLPIPERSSDIQFLALATDAANLISTGKPSLFHLAYAYIIATEVIPTEKQTKEWRKQMCEWLEFKPQPKPEHIYISILEMKAKNLSIARPASLFNLQEIASRREAPSNELPPEKLQELRDFAKKELLQ